MNRLLPAQLDSVRVVVLIGEVLVLIDWRKYTRIIKHFKSFIERLLRLVLFINVIQFSTIIIYE